MPQLLKMMKEEPLIKLRTRACSAMVTFVRGLVGDEEQEEKPDAEAGKLLVPYSAELLHIS